MRIWLIILALVLPTAALAQRQQQAAIPTASQEPIEISADSIEYCGKVLLAEGHVLFLQGQRRIYANRLLINTESGVGQLSGVTITTCCLPNPDYRLTAREIIMDRELNLKAKRVRVYLWNLRIISLPWLNFGLGPQETNQTPLPRPGFGRYDGFFLSWQYLTISTSKVELELFAKPTTKAGIQGGFTAGYAITGDTRLAPPYVPDSDSELRRQTLLRPLIENATDYTDAYIERRNNPDESAFPAQVCKFPVQKPHPSLFAAFGAVLRQRVYDVNDPNLIVTRLPEVGLRYVSPQVNVPNKWGFEKTGFQSETRASWGRFQESGETNYIGRYDVRCLVSSTLASLSPTAALRGAALARYSTYTTDDNYAVLGAELDLTKIFQNGSFGSVRLIGHAISGETPLQFDSVDIPYELQGAGRYVRGRNAYGVILDYDLQENSLRDWQFSVAHQFHCLEPSLTWHNRFGQISLNFRVLGL